MKKQATASATLVYGDDVFGPGELTDERVEEMALNAIRDNPEVIDIEVEEIEA